LTDLTDSQGDTAAILHLSESPAQRYLIKVGAVAVGARIFGGPESVAICPQGAILLAIPQPQSPTEAEAHRAGIGELGREAIAVKAISAKPDCACSF